MTRPAAKASRRSLFGRFLRNDRGSIAVEFTVLTPVMAMLLLASVEGSSLIWVRSSVSEAATAAADLTTQSAVIEEQSMTDIFEAAERMIAPEGGPVDGLAMTVSSVLTCPCQDDATAFCYSVIWSHSYENGRLTPGLEQDSEFLGLPQNLGVAANSTMVVAEAAYRYSPPITFIFFDDEALELRSRAEFRPRQSRSVAHVGGFQRAQAPTCP